MSVTIPHADTPEVTVLTPPPPRCGHEVSLGESHESRRQNVTVSFIVPAFNEEQHIGRCLRSIARQDLPASVGAVEVIVVDNQSTDRTAAVSRELGAQVVEVAPGYPSRARNAGAKASKGDWLAFVDADCELAPDWLAKCGSILLSNPGVVAAGGAFSVPGPAATWVERAWHRIAQIPCGTELLIVRWLTIHFLVRRTAFESAGGFDESLITCEDCDLGYKLEELGTLMLDTRTSAIHLGESHALGELFQREAWRTRGNVRLALSRPFDWSNWLSLLVPPCLVLGFLAATAGAAAATALHQPIWPWLGLMGAVIGAIILLVVRKTKSLNPVALAQQCVVFAVYLAGRSVGLLRSFQRIER